MLPVAFHLSSHSKVFGATGWCQSTDGLRAMQAEGTLYAAPGGLDDGFMLEYVIHTPLILILFQIVHHHSPTSFHQKRQIIPLECVALLTTGTFQLCGS